VRLTYDDFVQANPIREAFGSPLDCVFSNFDVVEPDLGSPSTRRRDEQTKRQLYERFGVSEYPPARS
jgi:hypothetical protein